MAAQRPTESVRDFGLRVQQEASLLGSLIPLSELKSLFSQGIQDPVRSNFVAGQTAAELSDNVPLTVLIGRAELLERGSDATVGYSCTFPLFHGRISRPVLSIPTTDNDEN